VCSQSIGDGDLCVDWGDPFQATSWFNSQPTTTFATVVTNWATLNASDQARLNADWADNIMSACSDAYGKLSSDWSAQYEPIELAPESSKSGPVTCTMTVTGNSAANLYRLGGNFGNYAITIKY
jgi:hypothetical protein